MVASELAKCLQISSNGHFLNFSLRTQKTIRVETVTSESIKSGLTRNSLEKSPDDEVNFFPSLVRLAQGPHRASSGRNW
jgi:hypothetical protein